MFWPGSIIALLLACYLFWLFVKLRRLTQLKSRLRRATANRQRQASLPLTRPVRRRKWKE
ncbi:MAG TPA: hypothetical protein DGH25_03730 [Erwiniaceae bacterium]|uniref:High mobility group protein Z n=2 Tax=Mixta TaxID=2100764 RepID=A0A1X1EE56_9GAMM|nr:hypothetical protein C2E15_21025 [Mixta gaviniae]AUY27021.1 hypothetical protein C2E16_20440 [Mixta calida]POU41666.1 hypothetical protein C3380_22585 [Pantoea sp. PSNIH5]POU59923.1 hypothetical protein C3374_22345 [Pantoea sp. PSNIH4]POY65899.1 hypothetical protein C3402_21040 [Pantoea sp. PSNIH3]HCW46505.1 hypothetical protein [Erwiniaceae bacterium]